MLFILMKINHMKQAANGSGGIYGFCAIACLPNISRVKVFTLERKEDITGSKYVQFLRVYKKKKQIERDSLHPDVVLSNLDVHCLS